MNFLTNYFIYHKLLFNITEMLSDLDFFETTHLLAAYIVNEVKQNKYSISL